MERLVPDALRRSERVRDATFDLVYPESIRLVSSRFWTPVDVAITAARWLEENGSDSVLDVGAGPGKFCIVASLVSQRTVSGIEQRGHLVAAARAAAAAYEAEVDFHHGTLESVDASRFDAFYLFNPFGENLYGPADRLDDAVELSEQRCFRDLAIIEQWLDRASLGTCVLTYHGFGGRIPSTYRLLRSAPRGGDHLRLWMKSRPGRAAGFFLEMDQVVVSSESLEAMSARTESAESRQRLRALLDRPLG